MLSKRLPAWLSPHVPALVPGLSAVALMLVWAVHNGGYDADTWYWGALVSLALFAGTLFARRGALSLPRAVRLALAAFALYVAWSYLSITWAGSKGDALAGSNRALLYFLMFALFVILPWTPRSALIVLSTFVIGVGAIALLLLTRLAAGSDIARLVIQGRLATPTGYFNSTAALFTIGALTAIPLAARRDSSPVLRGALIAASCAGLQLGVIVQSRGWLFTLPLIALAAIAVVRDRIRVGITAVIPVAATLVPLHRLLGVYQSAPGAALGHAASRAGSAALLLCGVAFAVATWLAWLEERLTLRSAPAAWRRRIGAGLAVLAVGGVAIGGTIATHGHPFHFISRQWHGFSHPTTSYSSTSHFSDVGSGRYDFWRVSLDAFTSHPIGGLGQDNFADYYVVRRHTDQEPAWVHSLELRLLAHSGFVGFALFATFLVAALTAALGAARTSDVELVRTLSAAALLPALVWLIHGSVDWFWEMPALSGPALGFLGMASTLGSSRTEVVGRREPRVRLHRLAAPIGGLAALTLATIVLGLPYLSVREVSNASNIAAGNPIGALSDLATAADLDPLSPVPGRLGGRIALDAGEYEIAEQRFSQAISREPGGWFAWFGHGLAASALGDVTRARHDFTVARSIDGHQPAIQQALARVDTHHPVTPSGGLRAIVLTQ